MWTYRQATGVLRQDGTYVATGYAGRGKGLNNPGMESVPRTGPLPQGKWRIGAPYDSRNTGRFTLPLTALDGTHDDVHQPTGRSAFRIHGDNKAMNFTASHGCIILPRAIRERIWASGDRALEVTP